MIRGIRVALLCISCTLPLACSSRGSSTPAGAPPPRKVALGTSAIEALPVTVLAYGSLAANDEVTLAFRNSGRIQTLDLDLGSAVSTGQVLAALDREDFELAVREADAAVHQARVQLGLPRDGDDDRVDAEATAAVRQARAVLVEATLSRDRVRELVERELRPPADLDAAVSLFDVAQSRVQQAIDEINSRQAALAQRRVELAIARRSLDESVLTAPFDGVVVERRRRAPEFVSAGETVLRLLDVDPLRLRLRVPEREALGILLEQDVVFTVDGVGGEFHGAVKRLSPAIDPGNRTLLVEAEVPNDQQRLRPGLFARARISIAAPMPCVVVPSAAVSSFAGVEKVFVVEGGVAREKRVRTGRSVGDRVELVEGLAAGHSVVLEPGDLIDGRAVVAGSELGDSEPADSGASGSATGDSTTNDGKR